jgi:undecaprenyl-diphosphatase
VPTFLIQIAGGLVNRLLPGGLGGLGINALYLRKNGYSLPAATAIVATNNTVGFVANFLLVAVTLSLSPIDFSVLKLPHLSWQIIAAIVGLVIVVASIVMSREKARQGLKHSWHEVVLYIRGLAQRPARSILAVLSSVCLTALHATALYLVAHATHAAVSWPVALLAISAGAFTGAAIPTPGGLGGAEAGIAGLLIGFSFPASVAVAAALVYRGLTYWIPLLPGYLALRIVEKRYL